MSAHTTIVLDRVVTAEVLTAKAEQLVIGMRDRAAEIRRDLASFPDKHSPLRFPLNETAKHLLSCADDLEHGLREAAHVLA